MQKRKVAVIGIDSITPTMIERFLAEGRMPNLQRLRDTGWSSEITPTMPPTTPAAWTTIATGSWPSTHGVEGFAVHKAGEALDKKHHSCSSDWVRSEFIWQAAERVGKKTILLKYPMSWPPTGGELVTQVDGAGGWGGLKCVWDLVHSSCWDTQPATCAAPTDEQTIRQEWITRDQDNLDEESTQLLQIDEPGDWSNLPEGAQPAWEAQLHLRCRGAQASCTLYLLALRQDGNDRVAIATSRDAACAQLLSNRQWSDWIRVVLPTAEGERVGHVRLKVMALDVEARHMRIYQSQVHEESGYTRPQSLAAELMEVAGPFAEWTEGYDLLQGWIDDETQLEVYQQHVEWMSRAARHLLRTHEWDLFMTQVHFVDMAYHLYWGAVDPGHPDYDADKAPFYWELLGKVHELADQFLGQILAELDDDTLVIVLGDHGHDLYHTALLANHLLIQKGWLKLYRDRRTGEPRIDWPRTRAYANGYRIYLNVRGRDPQGMIEPSEYGAAQQAIINMLYSVYDPQTGEAPVRLAVRREDAESIGLYGEAMGDVIFAMAPGYQTRSSINVSTNHWAGLKLQAEEPPVLKQTRLFREFTGEHDTALPFTRSIRSLLFMHGPDIRMGTRHVPVRMVDIAPTICHYLDIPFPEQCEGSPLWDVLMQPREQEIAR